jgi:tRNA-splicing ligase RtcB (3'-phosphate/5'-hydroxy nucleic acid ligase)
VLVPSPLSRSAAVQRLDQAELDRDFDARGVLGNFRHVPRDESHGAYEDVDEVVEAVVRTGVARIVRRLRPVLVLKGA